MAEVGADTHAVHAEVGAYAKAKGIDGLWVHGVACAHAAQAFGPNATAYETVEELLTGILPSLPAHVLVKGSRSARMERVVRALADKTTNEHEGDRRAS